VLNLNFFILKYILLLQLRDFYLWLLRIRNMESIQSHDENPGKAKTANEARKEKKAARKAFKTLRDKYWKVYCGGIGIPPSEHNIAEICNECKAHVAYLYYLGHNRENPTVLAAEAQYEMIRQCAEALATWMEYRKYNK